MQFSPIRWTRYSQWKEKQYFLKNLCNFCNISKNWVSLYFRLLLGVSMRGDRRDRNHNGISGEGILKDVNWRRNVSTQPKLFLTRRQAVHALTHGTFASPLSWHDWQRTMKWYSSFAKYIIRTLTSPGLSRSRWKICRDSNHADGLNRPVHKIHSSTHYWPCLSVIFLFVF
jgi:hypothetical protein